MNPLNTRDKGEAVASPASVWVVIGIFVLILLGTGVGAFRYSQITHEAKHSVAQATAKVPHT